MKRPWDGFKPFLPFNRFAQFKSFRNGDVELPIFGMLEMRGDFG
jgi:hypothetical protein